MKNPINTPYTNRGVVTPTASVSRQINYISNLNDSYILVDWIQCTLHNNVNVFKLFKNLFDLDPSDIIIDNHALFGYNVSYSYKNIKIFLNDVRPEMGIHIYITGSGCRDIEDLNIDYFNLFTQLMSYGCKFTRVDISIDLFTNKYFTIDTISRCINNGEVVSKFRNSIEFVKTNLSDSSNNGYTIWFGSRASKIQIVFYDKLKERICQNYIIDNNINFWLRLEMRFRDEYASQVIYNLINSDLNSYIFSLLNNYISFKDFNSSDLSHKYRWNTKEWWSDFLSTIDKIQFQKVNISDSITKKRNWLNDSVSRTNFIVFLSELSFDSLNDSYSSSFIYDFLKNGSKKITDSDLQFINDYRLKNSLNPLKKSEIYDFIRDVKDVIINKKG